jgi:predicted DNA repair protein MutK
MAGTSLFALIDDIASALDDISIMVKVATKKTAGVLGDDLALNAQQVIGIHAERELPVIWAVAKGSSFNKLILIPLALFISFFMPILVNILLMIGGLYLCYEGFEKIINHLHKNRGSLEEEINLNIDRHLFEREKIRGAVRTDFVLSAEIIVITLGTVTTASLLNQVMVLIFISLIMTIGVYGLVAFIVKLDDFGLILVKKRNPFKRVGLLLTGAAPILMKILSIVGTFAMFLVGGSIINHGIPILYHKIEELTFLMLLGLEFIIGILSGGVVAISILFVQKIISKFKQKHE